MKIAPFWALVFSLTACAPTRYYSLAVQPPIHREAAPGAPVSVAGVVLPPGFNHLSLTRFQSLTHVLVSARSRWVSSPQKLCREVLAEDLAQRLSKTIVLLPGQSAPGHLRALHIVIDRFVPTKKHQVLLRAHWSVSGSAAANGTARIIVDGSIRAATEAQVMSQALARLASVISWRLAQASHGVALSPQIPTPPRDTVF
ncbi:MAG: ABC-type transport auxiliary lipoprotein family protein [Gammaproteobacteria bacterium]|nr:ABC-type transport auxiliary lipoprotein family protein [Gammaproteobacteria bacterium]